MTISTIHRLPRIQHQQGIVLVVALLILVVMTILGVSMLSSATLEERMASNLQGQNLTFQTAESCIRTALLPANNALRDAAAINTDPVNVANLPLDCAFANTNTTAQVLYTSPDPDNSAESNIKLRNYSMDQFVGFKITMDSAASLTSGASGSARAGGLRIAPSGK